MVRHEGTLQVGILSRDETLVELVRGTLADMPATMEQFTEYAALEARKATGQLDLVVVDDACEEDDSTSGIRIIRPAATPAHVVLNVATEHRCALHLRSGAAEAIVAGSPTLRIRLLRAARRSYQSPVTTATALGDLTIEPWRRRVTCAGQEVHLTPNEWTLLATLAEHYPKYVSMQQLAVAIDEEASGVKARTRVQVCVCYLRRKLQGSRYVAVDNIRGLGYQLSVRSGERADGER